MSRRPANEDLWAAPQSGSEELLLLPGLEHLRSVNYGLDGLLVVAAEQRIQTVRTKLACPQGLSSMLTYGDPGSKQEFLDNGRTSVLQR
jgi:hypothetical protein